MGRFVLVEREDGWHGHFGVKRQRDGHDFIDRDTGDIAADFDRDIPLAGPWPDWFGEPIDVPDIDPADMLRVLQAADRAKANLGLGIWRSREAAEA